VTAQHAKPYPPVSREAPEALRRRLVEDAVAGVATPLRWAVLAYERIGRAMLPGDPGQGADLAVAGVEEEVRAMTGRGMPGVAYVSESALGT
jgi:hypothetical protein